MNGTASTEQREYVEPEFGDGLSEGQSAKDFGSTTEQPMECDSADGGAECMRTSGRTGRVPCRPVTFRPLGILLLAGVVVQ